jgi:hypothetical protein
MQLPEEDLEALRVSLEEGHECSKLGLGGRTNPRFIKKEAPNRAGRGFRVARWRVSTWFADHGNPPAKQAYTCGAELGCSTDATPQKETAPGV